jgi:hypothetical protein
MLYVSFSAPSLSSLFPRAHYFLGSPSFTSSSETLYDLDLSLFHRSVQCIFMHFLRCLKSSVVPPGRLVQPMTCAMLVVDAFLSF